jgi:hypothetical protein
VVAPAHPTSARTDRRRQLTWVKLHLPALSLFRASVAWADATPGPTTTCVPCPPAACLAWPNSLSRPAGKCTRAHPCLTFLPLGSLNEGATDAPFNPAINARHWPVPRLAQTGPSLQACKRLATSPAPRHHRPRRRRLQQGSLQHGRRRELPLTPNPFRSDAHDTRPMHSPGSTQARPQATALRGLSPRNAALQRKCALAILITSRGRAFVLEERPVPPPRQNLGPSPPKTSPKWESLQPPASDSTAPRQPRSSSAGPGGAQARAQRPWQWPCGPGGALGGGGT